MSGANELPSSWMRKRLLIEGAAWRVPTLAVNFPNSRQAPPEPRWASIRWTARIGESWRSAFILMLAEVDEEIVERRGYVCDARQGSSRPAERLLDFTHPRSTDENWREIQYVADIGKERQTIATPSVTGEIALKLGNPAETVPDRRASSTSFSARSLRACFSC